MSDLEKRVSQIEQQVSSTAAGQTAPTSVKGEDPFSEEKRKDRYELLKAEQRLQENLPEVMSYFKDDAEVTKDERHPEFNQQLSIVTKTHQAIAELCDELSIIAPKIIAAQADNSVSDLIARQRQIFKTIDALVATEELVEKKTRLEVSEYTADLIALDLRSINKVLGFLNQ